MLQEGLQGGTHDDNILAVHLVGTNLLGLDRLKCSCAYVERQLLAVNTLVIQSLKDILGEMKSCCRGCYGTLYLGIDSLVCCLVTFLCLAVKIWRYRKLADGIQDFRKTYLVGIPVEVNPEVGASGDLCVTLVLLNTINAPAGKWSGR